MRSSVTHCAACSHSACVLHDRMSLRNNTSWSAYLSAISSVKHSFMNSIFDRSSAVNGAGSTRIHRCFGNNSASAGICVPIDKCIILSKNYLIRLYFHTWRSASVKYGGCSMCMHCHKLQFGDEQLSLTPMLDRGGVWSLVWHFIVVFIQWTHTNTVW